MEKKEIIFRRVNCPICKSYNVVQVADHCSHGYNGYVCGDCKTEFGN